VVLVPAGVYDLAKLQSSYDSQHTDSKSTSDKAALELQEIGAQGPFQDACGEESSRTCPLLA
jgi:hypothetical protein